MVRSTALMQHNRSGPDPVRITALSVAMLANLTIFAFLMQPMSYTAPADPKSDTQTQFIRHEKVEPLPVPVDQTHHQQQHEPTSVTVHTRVPPLRQPPLTTSESRPMDPPAQPPQPPPQGSGRDDRIDPPGPVETALMPILSPAPVYPHDAMRDGITGTVLLELLVGVDGRVLEVHVVHSSGNRHLDDAAREQVLRSWRFEPAVRNGAPIEALGRVPIVFTLDGQQ